MNSVTNPRRGGNAAKHHPKAIKSLFPTGLKRAQESLLRMKCAKLFSIENRDISGKVDQLKAELERGLTNIPDRQTVETLQKAARRSVLLDQVQMHQELYLQFYIVFFLEF